MKLRRQISKKKKKKNYLPTYPIFFWPGERKHRYFFFRPNLETFDAVSGQVEGFQSGEFA